MTARALTDDELLDRIRTIVRDVVREETTRAAERLEARLRRQRPKGQRRVKAPELAAALAADRAEVDDVARAKAAKALARIRRVTG